MTFIGNILIIISTFIYLALVSALFGKEPPRGGDGVVGYYWGIIYLNVAFFVCMCMVTFIIGYKGGFTWISPGRLTRVVIISTGLLSAIITSALSGLFKYEKGPVPALLKFFSGFVPILIPLLLLVAAIILLNRPIQVSVPVAVYKWPLLIVFATGIVGVAAAAQGYIKDSVSKQQARVADMIKRQDDNHQRMLNDIDSCDVSKNIVFILVLTDANHDKEVKEKAVAKIKTNPLWQQELIVKLQNDWAPQVFTFLASNDVDDPKLFAAPVKEGILIQAKLIRESIRRSSHPSDFYPELFLWEIDRVLRTADKFSNMGVDYRSAVKELRAALDEPSDYKKPLLQCVPLLDEWVKQHP
jgi:hypothetical protein